MKKKRFKNRIQRRQHPAKPIPMAVIYKSELDYISRWILDYPNVETGGQLFGYWTDKGDPVVLYAIGPGSQANHQITFFNQDIPYLRKVNGILHNKIGLEKIGEWHSHHKLGLARPSAHDGNTVVSVMRKHHKHNHLLCIGNVDHKDCSTLNAFIFNKDHDFSTQQVSWKVVDMESPYRPLIDNCPDLKGVLCHPRTQNARHGENLIVEVTPKRKPNYPDGYWLIEKTNKQQLKNIIEYLTRLGESYVVTPMTDKSGIIHLKIQRGEENLMIVFGKDFPKEAPMFSFSDGSTMVPEWEYKGSIYDSFVECYNNFALAKPNYNSMYNF